MDSLLNPNIGYIALMASMLLTLMALLSPGTGVLEAGALVLLVFCGWLIYNLPTQLWALVLMLVGFVPLVLSTKRRWHYGYLIASIVCFLVGAAFIFKGESWVHPLLLLIVSALEGGAFWVVARKTLEAYLETPIQDLSRLIGTVGEARTDIYQEGAMFTNGELWSARSSSLIAKGKPVRVLDREGLILIVEEMKK